MEHPCRQQSDSKLHLPRIQTKIKIVLSKQLRQTSELHYTSHNPYPKANITSNTPTEPLSDNKLLSSDLFINSYGMLPCHT